MSRLRGQYRVVVADPFRGTVEPEVAAADYDLARAGAPDSLLILWMGLAGEGLLSLLHARLLLAYDYQPVAVHTWERVGEHGHGLPTLSPVGFTTSELFIICKRGQPDTRLWGMPPHLDSVHVWRAPVNPAHKPAGFYQWIEEQADGPYLAAYTNPQRAGWDTYGIREETN